MQYKLERKCADCGIIDFIFLTKMEAAFELYDTNKIWESPCSKCFSLKCDYLKHDHPKLDKEILDIWGNDPDLFLMEQDEELFLAEMDYLPMILAEIDSSTYLKNKIEVLLESICILLYDNTVFDENYSRQENQERKKLADLIRLELIQRKDSIKLAENAIMDYIKKEVFPQIGLEI